MGLTNQVVKILTWTSHKEYTYILHSKMTTTINATSNAPESPVKANVTADKKEIINIFNISEQN